MFLLPFIAIFFLAVFIAFSITAYRAMEYAFYSNRNNFYYFVILLILILIIPFAIEFKSLITLAILFHFIAKHKMYLAKQN